MSKIKAQSGFPNFTGFPPVSGQPVNQLQFINMETIKAMCESYNVQLNFIFKPNQIRIKAIKLHPVTGLQVKSHSIVISNERINQDLNITTLNRLIRNVTVEVF
jgi:hypothetical protein